MGAFVNFENKVIRAAAILTTSYVAGTVLEDCGRYNQIVLSIVYVKGSLTSLELKFEFSHDGVNYVQETASAVSGGTDTLSLLEHTYSGATAGLEISVPTLAQYVKISAKGTGTVTSSALLLVARLGVV